MRQTISEAWEKAEQTHDSLGGALSAVRHLESALRRELKERFEALDIPREFKDRMGSVVDGYGFRLDPIIRTSLKYLPPRRVEYPAGSGMPSGFMVYDPVVQFKVEIKPSLDVLMADMERFLDSLMALARPEYLREGRSMKKLITGIAEGIGYMLPGESSDIADEFSDTLCNILRRNFDIKIIDNPDTVDESLRDLYFDFTVNPYLEEPFMTSPAIVSMNKNRQEILHKGTILVPELKKEE